jgi:hypothetical protein
MSKSKSSSATAFQYLQPSSDNAVSRVSAQDNLCAQPPPTLFVSTKVSPRDYQLSEDIAAKVIYSLLRSTKPYILFRTVICPMIKRLMGPFRGAAHPFAGTLDRILSLLRLTAWLTCFLHRKVNSHPSANSSPFIPARVCLAVCTTSRAASNTYRGYGGFEYAFQPREQCCTNSTQADRF